MYIIESIVFTKLHRNHIPYISHIVVAGPRGGRYVLDEFNAEQLFKASISDEIRYNYTVREVINSFLVKNIKIKSYIDKALNEKELRDIAKENGCVPLIRKTGLKRTLELASKMELDKDLVLL